MGGRKCASGMSSSCKLSNRPLAIINRELVEFFFKSIILQFKVFKV